MWRVARESRANGKGSRIPEGIISHTNVVAVTNGPKKLE